MLKLIEIVIVWVYYTIPFCFNLFRHFGGITFQLFKLLCLAKVTDEVSVPEMRIWFILLIKSELKCYTSLFKSLFILYHIISEDS